jgi:DNA-binding response OmpR family regulator
MNLERSKLLLVEDDALIREVMMTELAEAGFEVVAVMNGGEAFAELSEDAARFRAVITDIKLGAGPDGWDVGRRTREQVPEMPVIYLSGDSSHEWASKGVPESVIIAKPFAAVQLVTAVSMLINNTDTHRAG